MTSDRVRAVQGRRSSGAAGPHRGDRPRGEVERAAIADQVPHLTADQVAELREYYANHDMAEDMVNGAWEDSGE